MEITKSIIWSIVVLAVLILCCLFILSQMNIQINEYYKTTCDKLNGTLLYYECYNSPSNGGFCDLDTTKVGTYCTLNNGTEVDINIKNLQV